MGDHSNEAPAADGNSVVPSTDLAPAVHTVAHQIGAAEADDESVQLAMPLALEPLPDPIEADFAKGLSLEAIEPMALANETLR